MNIFVKNLDRGINDFELETMFSKLGTVDNAFVIRDKFTKDSKGYGFVEMPNSSEAERAIEEYNGLEYKGRELIVQEAEPRKPSIF